MKDFQAPISLKKKKQSFLTEFASEYGYDGRIDKIRDKEYPQLKGSIYLDHTGSTTYAESVLANTHADLAHNLYGNPHSESPSSALATERVNRVRNRVLFHFNANPEYYDVIFTSNATAAIKIVAETFPWQKGKSSLQYLRENHTSIVGIRNAAKYNQIKEIRGVTEDEVIDQLSMGNKRNPHFLNNIPKVDLEDNVDGVPITPEGVTYNLFAYPAQCNFCGARYPLKWARKIKQAFNTETNKTLVLLDAAAYVTTSPLSLAVVDHSPDFVCLSFYKMFGYPTGLGALIIKKELSPILGKKYFGGGTVAGWVWDKHWQIFREDLTERYEEGTINFLSIIALDHAFDTHQTLYRNMTHIRSHVTSLATFAYREMIQLRHWNGTPVIRVNSDRDFSDPTQQGSILSFNIYRPDGSSVVYTDAVRLAGIYNISIRGGSHCNAGCLSKWHSLTAQELIDRRCGDGIGSLRVSIGAMTTIDDVLAWLEFIETFFVERESTDFFSSSIQNKSRNSIYIDPETIGRSQKVRNSVYIDPETIGRSQKIRNSVYIDPESGKPRTLNKKSSFKNLLRKRPSIPTLFH